LYLFPFYANVVHLHGHTFQVLYRSPPNTKYNDQIFYPIDQTPVRRDVIVVPPRGFVILAFRADNPGIWFLYAPYLFSDPRHCHIDWHVLMGMIAQFVEAPDVMQTQLKIPSQLRRQCKMDQCKGLTWTKESEILKLQAPWWTKLVKLCRSVFRF
jgi:hypothetical protein